MTVNFSNSLAALSVLTNSNGFSGFGSTDAPESRLVRTAKAQFDAPPSTPPWKASPVKTPVSAQVAAIKRMPTIIDAGVATGISTSFGVGGDIQTSFTTFKALDRLRLLAETSAAKTTSSAERLVLDAAFSRGLDDLQTFLGKAPVDRLAIAFNEPTRRGQSVGLTAADPGSATGKPVAIARNAALAGLTGTETFRIDLDRGSASDSIVVDLATGVQPPTLDSVVTAVNTAIAAIPARDAGGAIRLDADGKVVPKWLASLAAVKTGDKWGLKLTAPNPLERVSIDQIGSSDALVVATGFTESGGIATSRLYRFDDAGGSLDRITLGQIAAIDRDASKAAAAAAPKTVIKGVTPSATSVAGATTSQAVANDATGNSYVVGTVSGDIGSNRGNGASDLFLTKVDSQGSIVWQRSLGASGSASGAAISVAANGDIIVGGSVSGSFDGTTSDSDILVARFDAGGDEQFATRIRSSGVDTASAIAVGADGSIFVGGRSDSGGGDAFLARIAPGGTVAERRVIDSGGADRVTALAVGSDGKLLALTSANGVATLRRLGAASLATELGALSLGSVDARAIAIAGDGRIAVAGSSTSAGNRDGFVARIDAGLAGASVTSLGTAGDDQVDSIVFLGSNIHVGGRTTGDLGGTRTGTVDGFVARLDAGSGTVLASRQWGQPSTIAAPVLVGAASGGTTSLGALGLHRGQLNPAGSTRLVAQTSLRAGDEFSLRVGSGAVKRIVIAADETAASLAERIGRLIGSKTLVTAPKDGAAHVLRFQATETTPITLIAGAAGKDALTKLGLEPARLSAPKLTAAGKPKVSPGGAFGLTLDNALGIATSAAATVALDRIKLAITTTQGAYRSLYWDAGKAAMVNGYAGGNGSVSAYQAKQLAGYQAALDRLMPASDGGAIYTGF